MQPVPLRLSLAIRSAFKASRPAHRSFTISAHRQILRSPQSVTCFTRPRVSIKAQVRFFAEQKDLDKQIDELKSKIDDTIENRAEAIKYDEPVPQKEPALDPEIIIHTSPESSSFVHTTSTPKQREDPPRPKDNQLNRSSLPSTISAARSHLTKRLSHAMDNLQANIFTASRRLNDLTGYTGIEALKNSITEQESLVATRKAAVQSCRAAYAAAVATRSTTQREVNDLLHRKAAWSPSDLERFTTLYRSDHASEAAEAKCATALAEAESQYEEASNALSKSILARYHEEQIWSDKIRQMSTWGTWGLMGLNVLLFIVFQVLVEPWRRRRLVRGFEEKVQEALRLQQERHEGDIREIQSTNEKAEDETLSGSLVALVVDSVTGSSETDAEVVAEETAIEEIVTAELKAEHEEQEQEQELDSGQETSNTDANTSAMPAASGYAYYEEAFRELFSEKRIVLTQKELTTVAIEGACGGAAIMGLLLVLLRPR
jgi:sensitive to high expression protein 9